MRFIFLDVPLPGMDIWDLWYKQYLDKQVFCAEGFTVGASTTLGLKPQSEFFRQYFRNGNVDYVGRCNRYVRLKDKEIVNTTFLQSLRENERVVPTAYRKVKPNLAGGFKSISKYDKAQPVLDETAWRLAGAWTEMHFAPHMGGSSVLSEEIAIKESKKDTSCGYPWSLEFKDKNEFYASERARPALQAYWDLIGKEGSHYKYAPIWTCSEKVELRALEKLRDNKIRTFTASPIEHSVACNRLCLDMNNRFYSTNNKHWSFVGANKYQQGWDKLYSRLARHPNGFELDETEYDSSLFARAMWGQMEIRWNMLKSNQRTPENRRRLFNVYEAIVNSVIVLENGELVQKHTGNPSGSANTIVDNTMILFRLFAYAWIILCQGKYGKANAEAYANSHVYDAEKRRVGTMFGSYQDFMEHVEAALNGDDNTFTCSDYVVDWFNPTTIGEIWTGIGITTKTPVSTPRPVKDLTFLSHSFEKHSVSGLWLPCPESERVLCSLLYGSKKDDIRWHLLRACAIRIDSWPNEYCREIIQEYIEYLNYAYGDQMVGTVELTPEIHISMKEIRAVWKPDSWIEALYTGFEGSDGNRTICPFKNFNITELISLIDHSSEMGKSEKKQSKIAPRNKVVRAAVKAVAQMAAGPKTIAKGPRGSMAKNAVAILKAGDAPANTNYKYTARVPRIAGIKNGVRIRHTEFVTDLTSGAAPRDYLAQSWILNPARTATFPWLADQATSYATYRFHSLSFQIGSQVATSTDGMYAMASTPDVTDSTPADKTAFMQYENSVRNNVWCANTFHVPKDVLNRLPEYLTSIAASNDTTKSMGKFFVMSQGLPSALLDYGELYVTYDVELTHPQTPNAAAGNYEALYPATNKPFGTSIIAESGSTIVVTKVSDETYRVDAAGDFIVTYKVSAATVTTLPAFTPTYGVPGGFRNLEVTSLLNVNNGTTGVNQFLVLNAPAPWFLTGSGGTITTPVGASFRLNRDYNVQTESVTLDSLSQKVNALQITLEESKEHDEEKHITAPTPSGQWVNIPGQLRRC